MPQFVYRGQISAHLGSNRSAIRLDLGFRVHTTRTFERLPSNEPHPPGTEVIALVSSRDDGLLTIQFLPGDDPDGNAMLWHYPATLIKVIDGDTIDARVDLGCGVSIDERFRLSEISAPEIFGVPKTDPDYERGIQAKEHLERRLLENDGKITIVSSRQGKWRRWLAWVFAPPAAKSLNLELVDLGLAERTPV